MVGLSVHNTREAHLSDLLNWPGSSEALRKRTHYTAHAYMCIAIYLPCLPFQVHVCPVARIGRPPAMNSIVSFEITRERCNGNEGMCRQLTPRVLASSQIRSRRSEIMGRPIA